jgi:carbonic anhydrase
MNALLNSGDNAPLCARPTLRALLCAMGLVLAAGTAQAADTHAPEAHAPAAKAATKKIIEEELPEATPKEMGNKVREALGVPILPNKKLTLVINGKPVATAAPTGHGTVPAPAGHGTAPAAAVTPQSSRQYIQARAAALVGHADPAKEPMAGDAHGGEVHWAYDGENGPQTWGKLKPEFNLCAIGKRQSPINIQDGGTLQGPAEPVQFNYTPSNGTVVNNGHTIQVDVQGENSITVRGSTYRLLQFHFHTPSEEQVNSKRFSMVAHLVHKNDEGQLAVIAVLMEVGAPNPLIDKVWTYMPLDANDRVRMPREILNMNEILPADQRYFQFMGSLTTPPCTEGVLWMVLKQPMPISRNQFKLFSQLYPNNARPVQALNGRPVRDAQ